MTEYSFDRSEFVAGQVVIVDEASLAGTFMLDKIAAHAVAAGAKVLLVGDGRSWQVSTRAGRSG